jgi:hypothetical protein
MNVAFQFAPSGMSGLIIGGELVLDPLGFEDPLDWATRFA